MLPKVQHLRLLSELHYSHIGVVKMKEVLGNNTYLADCGNGPKHVSGDLISKVSGTSGRDIGGDDRVTQEIEQEDLLEDDNMSIASESSLDQKFLI